MSLYEIVELRVSSLPDGRKFIADRDVRELGLVGIEFVKRFGNYWARDHHRCGWVGPVENGEPS